MLDCFKFVGSFFRHETFLTELKIGFSLSLGIRKRDYRLLSIAPGYECISKENSES
jgi:hypothetical protein